MRTAKWTRNGLINVIPKVVLRWRRRKNRKRSKVHNIGKGARSEYLGLTLLHQRKITNPMLILFNLLGNVSCISSLLLV